MGNATIKTVKEFFGLTMTEMKEQWVNGGLTDTDKAEILKGLSDGTLTY